MLAFLLSFLLIAVLFVVASFRPINAENIYLLLIFGKPSRILTAGLRWTVLPLNVWDRMASVVRFPLERQQIDFAMEEIVTRAGYSKFDLEPELDEDGKQILGDDNQPKLKPKEGVRSHSQAVVSIDSVAFFSWPRLDSTKYIDFDNGSIDKEKYQQEYNRVFVSLSRAFVEAPSPTNHEALQTFFQNEILDELRNWASELTWAECIANLHDAPDRIMEQIRGGDITQEDSDSVFARAGILDTLSFRFKKVELPEELKNSLSAGEIGMLKAQEVIAEAEAEAEKITLTGKAEADIEALRIINVFKAIADDKEVGIMLQQLITLQKMSEGDSTIFAIAPGALDAVGGRLPAEVAASFAHRLSNAVRQGGS